MNIVVVPNHGRCEFGSHVENPGTFTAEYLSPVTDILYLVFKGVIPDDDTINNWCDYGGFAGYIIVNDNNEEISRVNFEDKEEI